MENNDNGQFIMHSSEQKIKAITKDFYEKLALFDVDSFVHKIASISDHIDLTYQSLLMQYDSRIFFGDTVKPMELSECEYNSFHIIRIISLVIGELQKNSGNQDSIHEIVSATTNRSDLPDWLKDRVIKYIPLLLLKKYSQDLINQPPHIQYVVFIRKNIMPMDKSGIDKFRKENPPNTFDIFIENTDYVSIYIQNKDKLFRAGNYHPFNILTLFLQRLGESLSYQEIYHLAIKRAEKTIPQDHSKKVYDYLKRIEEAIQNFEEINFGPEQLFKRDYNKGIVHISKSINSCLITTNQNLFI